MIPIDIFSRIENLHIKNLSSILLEGTYTDFNWKYIEQADPNAYNVPETEVVEYVSACVMRAASIGDGLPGECDAPGRGGYLEPAY